LRTMSTPSPLVSCLLASATQCCASRRHARYPCCATSADAVGLPAEAKICAPQRAMAIAASPTLPIAGGSRPCRRIRSWQGRVGQGWCRR
jgi:hypothetical protein